MTIRDFFSFRENRFFWVNMILMVVVVFVLIYGALVGVDKYTQHGRLVEVPDIKGLTVDEAGKALGNLKLTYIVVDSSFVKNLSPGRILEQNPVPGMQVKAGRVIYLTINSLSTPLRSVPDVADNSSLRQAQARILASGFKLSNEEFISGEKDWVYGVKYKGRQLSIGDKVPEGATLTLLVGDGSREETTDSLDLEEGGEPVKSEDAVVDESWF